MNGLDHTRIPRHAPGFTLVELMVATLLLGVVVSTAWMVFGSVTSTAGATSSASASSEEARRTLDILTGEVRQAVEATEGLGVFTEAEAWRCTFYCDANHDGVPEKIGYSVTDGAVYRTTRSSLTSAAPFDFSGSPQTRVYVSKLANATGTPLFRYYDAAGVATTVCKDISLARVAIVARTDVGGVPSETEMCTEVKVRSVNSTILE